MYAIYAEGMAPREGSNGPVCITPAVLWPSSDRKGLLFSGWLKDVETNVLGCSCDHRLYNAGHITKIDSVWKSVLGGVTGWP